MEYNDTEVRNAIRRRLIFCRKEAGLSQAEVGEIVGRSRNAVGSWEQGLSLPDLDTFLKLTKYYQKSLSFMFGDTDE
mgnify:FL=1